MERLLGSSVRCVSAADTGEEKEIMGGSCANCYYEDGYSDSQCSLRNPAGVSANLASQLKRILNFITPTGQKRLTAPRSFCSESKDDLRSFAPQLPFDLSPDLQGKHVPIIRSIPSLNRQFEESCAGKPSKLHIPHLAASAVAPKRDALMKIELELRKIGSDQDAEKSLELFAQEQEALAKLRARSMEKIKKSINCLQEAFVTFKAQEDKLGVKFLVRPSGFLQSPLAHYLNRPSFSTEQGRWENGETADPFNPCTRMVMENAFEMGKTVLFDHLHHRSNSCEDIEDTQSQILSRHESFTFDILESLAAKVIIVYSVKVQKRLLESRMLTFLPL